MIRVLNDIIPKSANPQVRIALFLLAYRWISLFIVIWLFQITPATYAAPVISVAVLVTAIIITSLITLFHQPLKRIILEDPFFLGVDIFSVAVILT